MAKVEVFHGISGAFSNSAILDCLRELRATNRGEPMDPQQAELSR